MKGLWNKSERLKGKKKKNGIIRLNWIRVGGWFNKGIGERVILFTNIFINIIEYSEKEQLKRALEA